jgi:small subunit ribosomal protein S16
MLKIRLQRVGRKNDPSFRLVLVDSRRAPQSSAFLEILGFCNPREKDKTSFKKERIEYWLSKGAQTTGTVYNLLVSNRIIKGSKVDVSPPIKKEEIKEKKKTEKSEK